MSDITALDTTTTGAGESSDRHIAALAEAVERSASLLTEYAEDIGFAVQKICVELNELTSSPLVARILFRCACREGSAHRARFAADVLSTRDHAGAARFLIDHALSSGAKPWQRRRLGALTALSAGTRLPDAARVRIALVITERGTIIGPAPARAHGSGGTPWLQSLLARLDETPVGIHHDVLDIHVHSGDSAQAALDSVLDIIRLLPVVPVLITESPTAAAALANRLAASRTGWLDPVITAPSRAGGYGLVTAGGGELLDAGAAADLVLPSHEDLTAVAASVGVLALYDHPILRPHRAAVIGAARTELSRLLPISSTSRAFTRQLRFAGTPRTIAELRSDLGGDLLAAGFCDEAFRLLTGTREPHRDRHHAGRLLRARFETGRFEEVVGDRSTPHHRPATDRLTREATAAVELLSALESADHSGIEAFAGPERKVLSILHASVPEQNGGYAVRAHHVLKTIAEHGCDVVAVTRPGFPETTNRLAPGEHGDTELEGIRYVRLGTRRARDDGEYAYMEESVDHYAEMIRRERPALVHLRSTYVSALPGLIAARRFGLPVIYEVSGMWELVYEAANTAPMEGRRARTVRLENAVLSRADAVLTLTEAMKDTIEARVRTRRPITLMPNAVDAAAFSAREKDRVRLSELGWDPSVPVIGYIGTFVHYEGLDILIRALAQLKRRGCRFHALLVGDGAEAPRLRALCRDLGLDETTVHFTGRVAHQAVSGLYSLIDVCAYPRRDTTATRAVSPLKPFEAMASMKAVIVSDVPALTEIVGHGDRGLVVAPDDPTALADALELAITDRDRVRPLVTAAGEWVRRERTWRRVGDLVDTVLTGLLGDSPLGDSRRTGTRDSQRNGSPMP